MLHINISALKIILKVKNYVSRKNIFFTLQATFFISIGFKKLRDFSNCNFLYCSQSSKLTDVSHHKGELSFVSKLRLQLIYDLWESCHKICGIIFHSENSNIITYERSRTNLFFAFKVRESDKKEIQLLEPTPEPKTVAGLYCESTLEPKILKL